MKKKTLTILCATVIILGFAKQDITNADYQPPKITSSPLTQYLVLDN